MASLEQYRQATLSQNKRQLIREDITGSYIVLPIDRSHKMIISDKLTLPEMRTTGYFRQLAYLRKHRENLKGDEHTHFYASNAIVVKL